jgi:Transposase DDE domain
MDLGEYVAYLMSSPSGSSCVKASKALVISHDEVNRFLLSGKFDGKSLFKSVYKSLDLEGGTLSVDDSVLDKPYSKRGTTELVGKFYSGKHHKVVQGINIIVLVYSSKSGYCVPVNFRVYRKSDEKTKNEYFQEMVRELWNWGLRPKWVTADSWYSGTDNLKFLRNLEINFMVGIESNRTVSIQPSEYQYVRDIDIVESGLYTHLNGYGFVQVFRTVSKDGDVRHYALYQQQEDISVIKFFTREEFDEVHIRHWNVENFFRAVKQCCQAEKFFVRDTNAIKTHLFGVLTAFQKLASLTINRFLNSVYDLKNLIFREAQRQFIYDFA